MNRKTALGAAAGLTLTVAGGVSALFLSMGQAAPAISSPADPVVVTEYVDQYGNPVDPDALTPAAPQVILVDPDGTQTEVQPPVAVQDPPAELDAAYQEPAYEEAEEYEAEEYEEEEYEEDEDEEDEYHEAEEHEAEEYEEAAEYEDHDDD